jgi:hypothetical protein
MEAFLHLNLVFALGTPAALLAIANAWVRRGEYRIPVQVSPQEYARKYLKSLTP